MIVFIKPIFHTFLFAYFILEVGLLSHQFALFFLIIRNLTQSSLCLYSSMITVLLEVAQSANFTFYFVILAKTFSFIYRFLPCLIFRLQFDIKLQELQSMSYLFSFLFLVRLMTVIFWNGKEVMDSNFYRKLGNFCFNYFLL